MEMEVQESRKSAVEGGGAAREVNKLGFIEEGSLCCKQIGVELPQLACVHKSY